jgi:ATP-binding cassette subfamily F protein uup
VNYLSVEKISKNYGDNPVLSGASFGLEQGEKVAVVGINGGGKSTLLKIIAGKETPDSGEVQLNKSVKVTFLEQNPEFQSHKSILDTILQGDSPVLAIVNAYHKRLDQDPANIDDMISKMDSLNAWDLESTINQMLGKLGIIDPNAPVDSLSGGMKKRVALAKALIEEPDLLILDEPTNHLDLEAIEWLENYLSAQKTTLLLVSHDRYFLDRVCNTILEVDSGNLYKHKGSYVSYLQNKEERKQQQQKDADKARNLLSKELDWLRRQPKARGTKAKYRVDAVYDLMDQASNTPSTSDLDLNIGSRRQGKKVMELKSIGKSFPGVKIIEDYSYTFKRGEKIGIIGKNGTGKSTFLNILTNSLAPDSGEIDYGKNTLFGYYKQEEFPFSDDIKVIDAVKEVAEVITTSDGVITASQLLNRFMFPPKKQHDFIGKLSGGEKKRLQLLRVLIKDPNFLILDEPTNDLDIVTLNILEEYLTNFKGCLLLVSHDRYFMDKLVDHLLVFKGEGEIQDFPGNYTDFRALENSVKEKVSTEKKEFKPIKPRHNEARKLTYSEKQEFQSLEGLMHKLEEQKAKISDLLNSGETDHKKLSDWGKELESINEELNEKELRWLELSEIAE